MHIFSANLVSNSIKKNSIDKPLQHVSAMTTSMPFSSMDVTNTYQTLPSHHSLHCFFISCHDISHVTLSPLWGKGISLNDSPIINCVLVELKWEWKEREEGGGGKKAVPF